MNSQEFTAYLQSKNIAPKNTKRYLQQVNTFAKWVNLPLEQVEKTHVLNYLHHLQNQNLTTGTRVKKLNMLNHYYTFLQLNGHIQHRPTALLKLRGAKRKLLPKLLTTNQMAELLDNYYQLKINTAQKNQHFYLRNYLILSLCIHQGLHRQEVLTLTLDCINLQKATVKIHQSNKRNARTLPLHATQIGFLHHYINQEREKFKKFYPEPVEGENELLINSNPELQKLMVYLHKIYPPFTDLKQLRSSCIVHWLGVHGLRKTQYLAGHRYISSTESYKANNITSLQNNLNQYHPLQ